MLAVSSTHSLHAYAVHAHDTVFGKSLQLPKIEHPTQEDIDKWHAIYMEELKVTRTLTV
jgi:Diacylglycerol acyltransferase